MFLNFCSASSRARTDRKAAAVEDFAELVKTICDGEEPMPDRVDQLLTETGKTTDELAAAVARRQTRLELAAKKAKLPELRKRLQGIAEKLDAEEVRWNAAATRHEETIEPLLSQARCINTEIHEAASVENKLRSSYVGPLTEAIADVRNRRQPIWHRKVAIERSREHHALELANAKQVNSSDGRRDHYTQAQIESHRRSYDNYSAQIKPLQDELAALDAEEKRLYEGMSEP